MNDFGIIHLIYAAGLACLGLTVGSFLNVCIYRIPWEKSVIWPGSHCPHCRAAIRTRDNIPVVGWLLLRGRGRCCGQPISARYPLVELLVGLLFVAAYLADGVLPAHFGTGPGGPQYVRDDWVLAVRVGYHCLLIALLVAITFIDADLTIVPASITNLGIILGLGIGTLVPAIRPVPEDAATAWGGLKVGLLGLAVGGGLIAIIRVGGSALFRREAMGAGDIHILAMIGAFLGWRAAVVVPFLAAFVGLVPALAKLIIAVAKRVAGRPILPSDRELPFGPYLSIAALVLMYGWPWIWHRALQPYFVAILDLYQFATGRPL